MNPQSEHVIAKMVAEGFSNPAIAQACGVSTGTIQQVVRKHGLQGVRTGGVPGPGVRFPALRDADALEAFAAEGLGIGQIAERLGCSPCLVSRAYDAAGVAPATPWKDECRAIAAANDAKVLELRSRGMTVREVAREMGISSTTVSNSIRRTKTRRKDRE